MTVSSRSALPELPSLTGLRYWAAFSILLNHLLLGLVARDNVYFSTMLNACGFLGMNMFFVLSGFIIHYNYHRKLADFRLASFYEFMLARFARLYPLFIVIFLVEFFTTNIGRYYVADIFKSLPFFLTMSHSWIYWKLETGQSLAYMYDRFSISWSISTEFLMYCGYPLLLWLFVRDRSSHRVRIAVSVVVCLACAVLIRGLNNNLDLIDKAAVSYFGPSVGMAVNHTYSFAWWLVWASPYVRFFEFIIGAVVAHNYLRVRDVPVGPREAVIMPMAGLFSLIFILATFLPPELRPDFVLWLNVNVGYFPFIALIIFGCARYDFSVVTRLFEWRFFVFFGECSYSMYLTHIFIYSMLQLAPATPAETVMRILVTWASVFACSYVLYMTVEMPARRWLRSALGRGRPASTPLPAPG